MLEDLIYKIIFICFKVWHTKYFIGIFVGAEEEIRGPTSILVEGTTLESTDVDSDLTSNRRVNGEIPLAQRQEQEPFVRSTKTAKVIL
jgi:hypothetical protein